MEESLGIEEETSEKQNRFLPLLSMIICFWLGAGLVFAYFQLIPSSQQPAVPTPSPTPTPVDEVQWIESTILGRGLVFKYPKGWHLALDGVNGSEEELYQDYDVLYMSDDVIALTILGVGCDYVFYVKNNFTDPEAEFERILDNERTNGKNDLIDFKEEVIPSEDFGNIYHLTGKTQPSDRIGSQKVEKYFFISPDEEPLNTTIVAAEVVLERGSDLSLFQEIVMSLRDETPVH
jgi:hypothetical protein